MGLHPFRGCLDQDWVGTFKEVIRIAGGKPLELEFGMSVSTEDSYSNTEHPGEDEYMHIMEKADLLSDYPNICAHCGTLPFEIVVLIHFLVAKFVRDVGGSKLARKSLSGFSLRL